jgi:hypothetical protein
LDPLVQSPRDVTANLVNHAHYRLADLLEEEQREAWEVLVGESFAPWDADSPFEPQARPVAID